MYRLAGKGKSCLGLSQTQAVGQRQARQYGSEFEAKLPRRWTWKNLKNATRNADLAISHFDNFYTKVYGDKWSSIRLGLLSPNKSCAILNTFLDIDPIKSEITEQPGVVDLEEYYKRHLRSWTHTKIRQELMENKRARRREMMAREMGVDASEIDPSNIVVSDISESELTDGNNTSGGLATPAEDLLEMFSDRKMDDDEKYFINRASTNLNLNDYVPAEEMIYREDPMINDLSYLESYVQNDEDFPVRFSDGAYLEFSERLKIFTHARNNWNNFEIPLAHNESGLLKYYFMDGASILPVLALDIKPNDVCADYCASPGGKALSILMTLKPSLLLCNDVSLSRVNRLKKVFRQYAPSLDYVKNTVKFTNYDAKLLKQPSTFDKILVDAPCTNDRLSARSEDNNLFKISRTEERVSLPLLQRDILVAALSSVKPRGVVVYSTCTMSPVQNDGVVHAALKEMFMSGHEAKFTIINLKESFRPLRGLYKFHPGFKYGQQIVPNVCSNFGPMYISKIKRES